MTIKGHRYRLGNPNHPFYEMYMTKGMETVFKAMGLETAYKKADEIRKTVLALYDRTEDGDVYLISNPAWDGWLKCGMAVDASDRCKSYNTGTPWRDYEVVFKKYTEDRHKAEKKAHALLKEHAEKVSGEWFKINHRAAKSLLSSIL
jgi:hypothetical protein